MATNGERLAEAQRHIEQAREALNRAATAPQWAHDLACALACLHDTLAALPLALLDVMSEVANSVEDGGATPGDGLVRCPKCGETTIRATSEHGEPFRYQCGNCDHCWRE